MNNMIGLQYYIILSSIVFIIGFTGLIISKNLIKILICIEIMINAVCINIVAIARYADVIKMEGFALAIFIMMVFFVNTIIIISIILNIFKHKNSIDVEELEELKG